MVIGVCGFGYSGSGAVWDLLKEFSGLSTGPSCEFSFLYRPDGINDLFYHIENPYRYFSSDVAIIRFQKRIHEFFRGNPQTYGLKSFAPIYKLTDNYIESLSNVIWKGWWSYDMESLGTLNKFVFRILNRMTSNSYALNNKVQKLFLYRDMHLAVDADIFIDKTKLYLREMLKCMNLDIEKDIVVLNQVYSADNPLPSMQFFDNSKAILVDKDPRDLYLLCKKESIKQCSWTPTEDVEKFVSYYYNIRRRYSGLSTDNILIINIEDLIYEYEQTIKKIVSFIGKKEIEHVFPKKFFIPEQSINNTQLFNKHIDMLSDIKYIENNLGDYLYPFEKYPVLKSFGKSF